MMPSRANGLKALQKLEKTNELINNINKELSERMNQADFYENFPINTIAFTLRKLRENKKRVYKPCDYIYENEDIIEYCIAHIKINKLIYHIVARFELTDWEVISSVRII